MTHPLLHFCTYFDSNYAARALVLHRSLRETSTDFHLWALCLDDESHRLIEQLRLPRLSGIALSELERHDQALLKAKTDRSRIEYYFTLTPTLPLFLMDRHPGVGAVSYLDADLRFYSSPKIVLDHMDDGSIVIPHGFPERLRHLEVFGRFNVGMVTFRNDSLGRQALERWRAQCLEWCYDRVEDGRFADQAYLDDWPDVLQGVRVVDVPGIGLGPWNASRFAIDIRRNVPTVDGSPLVFYHFHNFKSVRPHLYNDGLLEYGGMPQAIRRFLYGGYIRDLREASTSLRSLADTATSGRSNSTMPPRALLGLMRRRRLLYEVGAHVFG